jgi:hypothetical protein
MRIAFARIYLSVLFGVFGSFSAVWALVSLDRDDYLSALVVTGFAVFGFGMVTFIAIVAKGNVTARVTVDAEGTTFKPDRKVNTAMVSATLGAFAAMALYAVLVPLGLVNIPVPGGWQLYFVIACAVGVLAGLPSLKQIVTKGGLNTIRLTVGGFEFSGTYSTVVGAWSVVADVADKPPNEQRPLNTGTTYMIIGGGSTLVLTSDWYTPDGDALRRLVRFYWRNADKRHELTDGTAVKRFKIGD